MAMEDDVKDDLLDDDDVIRARRDYMSDEGENQRRINNPTPIRHHRSIPAFILLPRRRSSPHLLSTRLVSANALKVPSINLSLRFSLQPTGTLYRRRLPTLQRNLFNKLTNALFTLDTDNPLFKPFELFEFLGHDFSGKVKGWEFRVGERFLDGGVEFGGVGGGQGDERCRCGTTGTSAKLSSAGNGLTQS
jgi:hypothetical protein